MRTIERAAIISADGFYRYTLTRRWADGPLMNVVMLNPSTADGDQDDPTIRRCMEFAVRHRNAGLVVTNLFAWRATDPRLLRVAADPVGPENDRYICETATQAGCVVAAWGAFDTRLCRQRREQVDELLGDISLLCFGKTAGGLPRHPLYLPYDVAPFGYRWRTRLPVPEPVAGRDA